MSHSPLPEATDGAPPIRVVVRDVGDFRPIFPGLFCLRCLRILPMRSIHRKTSIIEMWRPKLGSHAWNCTVWVKFMDGCLDRTDSPLLLPGLIRAGVVRLVSEPMSELGPEIVAEVVEACKAGAEEIAAALERAFDLAVTVSVGEPGTLKMQDLPEELAGSGLAVVLTVGQVGALLTLPERSGLLPGWCGDPDPTGRSKLTTLAQELGMLLLPEPFVPDDFAAAHVDRLSDAIARGAVAEGAAMVPLQLEGAEGSEAVARLIWPARKPADVIAAADEPAAQSGPQPEPKTPPKAEPAPEPREVPELRFVSVEGLPLYAQSLLRIKVPVVVTLAEKRQSLGRIKQLGPGSIIQFEKSCEEMLELSVGGRPVATGEAVKVGDKFGLRINAIVLPGERFRPVKPGPAVGAR